MAKKSGSLMGGGCGVVKKEAGYCIANGSKGGNNPTTRGQTGRSEEVRRWGFFQVQAS